MALELAATVALVLANAFFVGTEFALARLRPTQVSQLERASVTGAGSVRHAVEHIDAYLAACQLGITLASIGLGVVGKPFFQELLEPLLGGAAAVAGFAVAGAWPSQSSPCSTSSSVSLRPRASPSRGL